MIPAAFDYVRASSLMEALHLLRDDPDGTRLLAGGHTLLPALKLRLSTPDRLLDIGGVTELKGIEIGDNSIRIGALTTHAELLGSEALNGELPIFRQAAALIADPQVRNRGTIGGSLANADPAADWPAIVIALQRGDRDRRRKQAKTRGGRGFLRRHLFDDARARRDLGSRACSKAGAGHAIYLSKDPPSRERLCCRRCGRRRAACRTGLSRQCPSALRVRQAMRFRSSGHRFPERQAAFAAEYRARSRAGKRNDRVSVGPLRFGGLPCQSDQDRSATGLTCACALTRRPWHLCSHHGRRQSACD